MVRIVTTDRMSTGYGEYQGAATDREEAMYPSQTGRWKKNLGPRPVLGDAQTGFQLSFFAPGGGHPPPAGSLVPVVDEPVTVEQDQLPPALVGMYYMG